MSRLLPFFFAALSLLVGCPMEYTELNCPDHTMYLDADQDGFGAQEVDRSACQSLSEEEYLLLVTVGEDCDDTNPERFPGNAEICDGFDNDCDDLVDDEDDTLTDGEGEEHYLDADADGYGDPEVAQSHCALPEGWAVEATDCDDAEAAVHPGADELCNEVDDDCNGLVDDDPVDPTSWYPDLDGDGYGDADMVEPIVACTAPGEGWIDNDEDCNDASPAHHPGATEDDCTDPEDYNCDGSVGYADADGDGWAACEDCDDGDAGISPLGTEVCDTQDNDCDGTVDEPDAVDAETWYADADGDGFGDATSTTPACDQPSGYTDDDTDCDDSDATVYPGATTWYLDHDGDGYGDPVVTNTDCLMPSGYVADSTDCDDRDASVSPAGTEVCDETGTDEDCDTLVDDDDPSVTGTSTWYADTDADGFGDATSTTAACDPPSGYTDDDTDCDDTDATVYPGATTWYADADADGYGDASSTDTSCAMPSGYVTDDTDCDDTDSAVSPGATESCSEVDDDCDGLIDDDDPGVTGTTTWYIDSDSDGYGASWYTTTACEQPSGFEANDTDCDDTDASINTDGTEVCDGEDNDCDGTIDEDDATDASTWYADADSDGYGDASTTEVACSAPSGYVEDDSDCDDTEAAVNPGATETCNSTDDDCDGVTDEDDASDAGTWYADDDADGYGDASDSEVQCAQPSGYVSDDTDCDDTDSAVNPGATEVCNGTDDCNGDADDDDSGVTGTTTWYLDADGDGYGTDWWTEDACDQPTGFDDDDEDCDDTDASINPDGEEVCDSEDNDCDGTVDEDDATDALTWYADSDSDGFGDASSTDVACSAPSGYVSDATDCDDTDADTWPGADEYCDTVDNDCDGTTDEDDAVDASTWYADGDSDGYGDSADSEFQCSQPSGYVSDATDCDDTDGDVSPAASEVCDGEDNDCDGLTDDDDPGVTDQSTWYPDADSDGYGNPDYSTRACEQPSGYLSDSSDCDDSDADAWPGADETCDGDDDDCDGAVDEDDAVDVLTWYADADGDGYGDASSTDAACSAPSGYVSDATDCDDTDGDVNPAADELCNTVDDDCDGTTDEDDAVDASTWYADDDSDGYGDATDSEVQCAQPSGYVSDHSDCDDTDADISPSAEELCADSTDNDCDGSVDEGDAVDASTWYADDDGDTYGDPDDTTTACSEPSGYVGNDEDCDDSDSAVSPDATEVCDDGVDDDCDGDAEECWLEDLTLSSSTADVMIYSSNSNETMGREVYAVDLDLDGTRDLLIGGDNHNYVYGYTSTPSSGVVSADITLSGCAHHADAGNVDGDSYADFVCSRLGTGYLMLDVTAGTTTASSAYTATYTGGGTFGVRSHLTDAYDEGTDAVIFSAHKYGTGGEVYIYSTATTPSGSYTQTDANTTIETSTSSAYLRMSNHADLDGDGVDDLILSAPYEVNSGTDQGAVFVFLSPVSTGTINVSGADAEFWGDAGDTIRHADHSATDSDIDGDGSADLILSPYASSSSTDPGGVLVFTGSLSGSYTTADAYADFAGVSVGDQAGQNVGIGDVDGDGSLDLAVGAHAGGDGAIYLEYGPISAASYDLVDSVTFTGPSSSWFSRVTVLDLNSDGLDDLVMGAMYDDTGATDAGAVYMLFGTGY